MSKKLIKSVCCCYFHFRKVSICAVMIINAWTLNFQVCHFAWKRLDVPDDQFAVPSHRGDGVDVVFVAVMDTKFRNLKYYLNVYNVLDASDQSLVLLCDVWWCLVSVKWCNHWLWYERNFRYSSHFPFHI